MSYQEERFKTAEARNSRWEELRQPVVTEKMLQTKRGSKLVTRATPHTAHVVRYSVSVGSLVVDGLTGKSDPGHTEFIVAWPVN